MSSNRVYVDVFQTIEYLCSDSSLTGIQRVVLAIVDEFNSNGRNRVIPICYRSTDGNFVELDYRHLVSLVALLDGPSNKRKLNEKAEEILLKLNDFPVVCFKPRDLLLVLERVWIFDNYFAHIHRQRLNGVLVITMLYDLVPILDSTFLEDWRQKFHRYLHGVSMTSDRVITISDSTRKDYSAYCTAHSLREAPGCVTELPGGFHDNNGLARNEFEVEKSEIWPQPYVLMVGTIEVRKNHIVALQAWKELIQSKGSQKVPDLVCVGIIGWNVDDFLAELASSNSTVKNRVHLLTDNVSDNYLRSLYENCLFTIYPSSYEGWGLPVSESLDFGKAVITTNVSSMPEAGMEFARYIPPNDSKALALAVKEWIEDPEIPHAIGITVTQNRKRIGWTTVVNRIVNEIDDLLETTIEEFAAPKFIGD